MVRIQLMPTGTRSGIARFYTREDAGPLEDYVWLCMLNWDEDCPEKDVWIHGLKGEATFRSLRQLVTKAHEMGFKRIRALRKEGHLLPRAKEMPDGSFVMLVSDLLRVEIKESIDE